tara:strand:- start:1445 stop:1765 length:321 start_codon:yes stop_codon:yes gene_type:complete
MISIHELYDIDKQREKKQKDVYEQVLSSCFKKIKRIAEHGGHTTYYEVPYLIFGLPLFDNEKCCKHILKVLKKGGYVARIVDDKPNAIYISWLPADVKKQYSIKNY